MTSQAQGSTRYILPKQLFANGSDYDIVDAAGRQSFHVDGRMFRLRAAFVISDDCGEEVVTIRQSLLSLQKHFTITHGSEIMATVRKELFTPRDNTVSIHLTRGTWLLSRGNLIEHEYIITRDNLTIAEVSQSWSTVANSYGITIVPGEDNGLILAVAVIIDDVLPRRSDSDYS